MTDTNFEPDDVAPDETGEGRQAATRSLSVTDRIRSAILSGSYEPGARLHEMRLSENSRRVPHPGSARRSSRWPAKGCSNTRRTAAIRCASSAPPKSSTPMKSAPCW